MPAVSGAQQRLMAAAEHGANFALAKKVRRSMTMSQLHDFAATPRKGLPNKVGKAGTSAHHPGGGVSGLKRLMVKRRLGR